MSLSEYSWTPEPWVLCEEDEDVLVWGGDDRPVISKVRPQNHPRPDDERAANLRRIVVCVNACAGVPTDDLRPGWVRERPIGERVSADRRQRDELVALLEQAYDALPHGDLTTRIAVAIARTRACPTPRRPS